MLRAPWALLRAGEILIEHVLVRPDWQTQEGGKTEKDTRGGAQKKTGYEQQLATR